MDVAGRQVVEEEEEKGTKDEESEPKPPAESEDKGGKASASESSSEPNRSCDSESLDVKLSALDNGPLHIEEGEEDEPVGLDTPKANGLENGFNSESKQVCL